MPDHDCMMNQEIGDCKTPQEIRCLICGALMISIAIMVRRPDSLR